ncbi:hypothetical protein NHX12_009719 [Muraenolepis orangiensis]|uniref:Uncharacterized protein n=1 Tax=Muraenolepis orangiensis TaxID=630683 RepID=A0A9Q0I864_9TELE|nr:hypothetical protein NHX12_009719 [Muraenolepis orangiensis]
MEKQPIRAVLSLNPSYVSRCGHQGPQALCHQPGISLTKRPNVHRVVLVAQRPPQQQPSCYTDQATENTTEC